MPKFASTMPSYLTVSAKEITCGTMMSWKLADDEKATLVMVHLFPSPIATFLEVWLTNFFLLLVASDIYKKLELGPDMAKVSRALNIHPRFREWRWLLSEYREEDGGLPLAKDVERWK
ncbi:hypothetical protein GBA52_020281 [Prunus armeniaca]|nr:hypothetical protein GBA52_020281 [Prunus armeniaca]